MAKIFHLRNYYGDKLPYRKVKKGMWVVKDYEGEKFLEKVQSKCTASSNLLCLEKPWN